MFSMQSVLDGLVLLYYQTQCLLSGRRNFYYAWSGQRISVWVRFRVRVRGLGLGTSWTGTSVEKFASGSGIIVSVIIVIVPAELTRWTGALARYDSKNALSFYTVAGKLIHSSLKICRWENDRSENSSWKTALKGCFLFSCSARDDKHRLRCSMVAIFSCLLACNSWTTWHADVWPK